MRRCGKGASGPFSRAVWTVTAALLCVGVERTVAAPPWASTLPQDRKALYVLGVATAKTIEDAQRAALLNAAVQVAEHIEVTVGGSGTRLRTELEQRLTEELTFASEQVPLTGGLVQKWHFEDAAEGTRAFVLVRYPRAGIEEAITAIKAERAERIARGRQQLQRGDRAWDRGRFDVAFDALSGLLGSEQGTEARKLEADARERLTALLSGLDVTVVSGDGQVVDPTQELPSTLVVRVVSHRNGEVIPMSGVPIRFARESGGTVVASVLTDEAGEAWVRPGALDTGRHRILAEIAQAALSERLAQHAPNEALPIIHAPGVVLGITVVAVQRQTRVVIVIRESHLGQASAESIVAETLSERLAKSGYRVVAEHEIGRTNLEHLESALNGSQFYPLSAVLAREADVVVAGTADTRPGSENMGWTFSTHASVSVRAIDLRTGEVVAQQNVTGRVGFGESYERAGIRALEGAGRDVAQAVVDQLVLRDEEGGDVQR